MRHPLQRGSTDAQSPGRRSLLRVLMWRAAPSTWGRRSDDPRTVHVGDDFPAGWQVVLTRSSDGTPLVDITTLGGPDTDHDRHGRPFLRVFAGADEVYEYMSPAAQRWRDEELGVGGPW